MLLCDQTPDCRGRECREGGGEVHDHSQIKAVLGEGYSWCFGGRERSLSARDA